MKTNLAIVWSALFAAALSNPVFADSDVEQEAIRVRPVAEGLDVKIRPTARSFGAGDAIRFNVRGNEDFFLYLFAVDERSGTVTMILPNAEQSENKYPADTVYPVPNANQVEFFSDLEGGGTEHVVMVASRKYIPWSLDRYSAIGKFYQTEKSVVDDQLEAVRVRPVSNQPTSNYVTDNDDVVVADLSIEIRPLPGARSDTDGLRSAVSAALGQSMGAAAEPSGRITVFASTDRLSYRAGDRAQIAFGATAAGYVHLYNAAAGGRTSHIHSAEVDGNHIESITATATAPIGRQAIVAVFTENDARPGESAFRRSLETTGFESVEREGMRVAAGRETHGVVSVHPYRVER